MKTNASVVTKNLIINFPNGKRVQNKWNQNGALTIENNALGLWIDSINKANGVFYLHLDESSGLNNYSIHYKCHKTGKLMEMEFDKKADEIEDPKKAYLNALLFDLDLFEGNEPIVVFDKKVFINHLQELFPILFQHTDAFDAIMGRLYDLKEVFDTEMYHDTLFSEISVKEIHKVLYGHESRQKLKMQDSLAMYQIFEALQSIYYQVTGLKVA